MAIGFFDGNKADASPESIKRKRAMIARLMQTGRAPRDVGEGLNAIGRGLQAAVLGSRADAAEQASNASSADAMRGIYSGFGSPMASAGNPVATGSGATRVVAAPEQFAQLFAEKEAKHSLPQGYLARAAQIESNFNPSAKNPNSSAGGLFQFIDGTARQYGLRNRFDPVEATAAAARLAADNRDFLARRLGREPSAGELYLAHQQGAGGAAKLLANPDALASSVVGNAAARLNRGAGMTAGAFANQWINKFGTPVVRPGPGATPMPLQTASAGPQSNDAQMQDGAGELQAGGSEMMGGGYNPFLPRDMAPTADAMGQGIADNEEQTRMMEAQMAAEQGLPYAGNEPGQFNSMFSPDPMGGGLNPFVPRDMVQPEDAIAQAPVPMPPQMDRATFDQVTAGLPQRAPAFAGQGLAPSWAGDPDKLAPGAEQASFVIPARDTVALPAANNRPPQSPLVPPAMRQPIAPMEAGENSGGAMQFIESEFARREGRPDPRSAIGAPPAQIYNAFVPQAPQMPAGGGSVQGVSQGDTVAGGPAQAPAQASNRIAELASIAGNPMVRPEVRQLAMAEIQTERARALAEADRARTEAQNRQTAEALNIDPRLGGVAPTNDQKDLAQANKQRREAGLPILRMDEYKLQKARAGAASVSVDASQKAQDAFGVETSKALAKRFDEMVGDGDVAAQNLELVTELRRLGGRIDFGAPAVAKGLLGRFGIKTDGISDIEAFNTLINRLTPQQRLPGSGATSDFDAKMFKESLPQLMNTPEGNKLIIDTIEKVSQNRMARGEIAMRVQMGELDRKDGIAELRRLQAEARSMSDVVRDFGKKKPPPNAAPGTTSAPPPSQQGQPSQAEIEAEMKRRGLR
jgi:hypothetical protein